MKSLWLLSGSDFNKKVKACSKRVLQKILPDTLSEEELGNLCQELLLDFKKVAKSLRRLKKIPHGSKNKMRGWHLYRSVAFQKTMFILAMWNKPKRMNDLELTIKEFNVLPSKLCNVTKQAEKFKIYYKPKSSGKGTRPICNFGNIRYIQQYGVKTILEAIIVPFGNMYGAYQAVQQIGSCLTDGKTFVKTTDVKNSFSSITKTHVRGLGLLDDRIIKGVIFPSACFSTSCPNSLKGTPQTLLPQGGAASTLIQSLVIDAVLRQLPKTKEIVIASADNIAICSESPQGAIAAFNALKWRMENHPAGSLILHDTKLCDGRYFNKEYRKCSEYGHIFFMGYKIAIYPPTGEVSYKPNQKAFDKFWQRVQGNGYTGDLPVWHPSMSFDYLKCIALAHFIEWSKSFGLWEINRDLIQNIYEVEVFKHKPLKEDKPHYHKTHSTYTKFAMNLSEKIDTFWEHNKIPLCA